MLCRAWNILGPGLRELGWGVQRTHSAAAAGTVFPGSQRGWAGKLPQQPPQGAQLKKWISSPTQSRTHFLNVWG